LYSIIIFKDLKPFILQFKEACTDDTGSIPSVVYNSDLNLNIDPLTNQPAIAVLDLRTETVTKVHGEGACDSDKSNLSYLMATRTSTFTSTEASDSDQDRQMLLRTLLTQPQTRTFNEPTEESFHNRYDFSNHA
jgi:hypothetical protein